MVSGKDFDKQKQVIKDIILDLHRGLSFEEAQKRLEQEVGSISSHEIAQVEQSLIDDGMTPDEIKKFCNVHALLFESSLEADLGGEQSEAHPVKFFKEENREIEKITTLLKDLALKAEQKDPVEFREEAAALLDKLSDVEQHYVRKEQILFPYLERYGFMGPTQVMWGKHNEIRDLFKQAQAELNKVAIAKDVERFVEDRLNPLVEEVDGMIFKEENILFPTSLEKLQTTDWVDVLKESDQVGYAFIEPPADTAHLADTLKKTAAEEPSLEASKIKLPSGELTPKQLMHMLNALPVDITFVDQDDVVRYFSENEERIFVRTRAIIGRKVENCHPPQSVDQVQKIVSSFKDGTRDSAEFWINLQGKMIYIIFFAIRDENGRYVGALEVAQDITRLQQLTGERRLLDEGN